MDSTTPQAELACNHDQSLVREGSTLTSNRFRLSRRPRGTACKDQDEAQNDVASKSWCQLADFHGQCTSLDPRVDGIIGVNTLPDTIVVPHKHPTLLHASHGQAHPSSSTSCGSWSGATDIIGSSTTPFADDISHLLRRANLRNRPGAESFDGVDVVTRLQTRKQCQAELRLRGRSRDRLTFVLFPPQAEPR